MQQFSRARLSFCCSSKMILTVCDDIWSKAEDSGVAIVMDQVHARSKP
jgi:hypothetical protein